MGGLGLVHSLYRAHRAVVLAIARLLLLIGERPLAQNGYSYRSCTFENTSYSSSEFTRGINRSGMHVHFKKKSNFYHLEKRMLWLRCSPLN